MNYLPNADDLTAIYLTLKLAGLSTVILLAISLPLAWWLSLRRSFIRSVLEACFCLPVVLPPSVLGFYLLMSFGEHGPIGWLTKFSGRSTLAFSFHGLVIGSVFYSFPFVIQPLQNSFESINKGLSEAAAMLGAGPVDRFFSIVLPAARNGLVTAAILGFAHTVGEFGVVLMIGGNIPGETRVMSIAIYDHVESLEFEKAHSLSFLLLLFSFITLISVSVLNKGKVRARLY